MLNEFDPQWTDLECSLFKPPHDLQRMHLKVTKHGRFCKQKNQLPTKTHDELKDNSNITRKFGLIFFCHYIKVVILSSGLLKRLDYTLKKSHQGGSTLNREIKEFGVHVGTIWTRKNNPHVEETRWRILQAPPPLKYWINHKVLKWKLCWHTKPLGGLDVHMVNNLQINMHLLSKILRVLNFGGCLDIEQKPTHPTSSC